MTESNHEGDRWVLIAGAVVALGFGGWLVLGGPSEGPDAPVGTVAPPAPSEAPAAAGQAPGGQAAPPRIEAGGRLTLDLDALAESEPVVLALDLADDARGEGERSVTIVSVDGRRTEAVAVPLEGSGTGVRLEIERGFLSAGTYMIQVDTVDGHPLQIRRYVLEAR